MRYPNRIKELSEELGWKQADLAREVGLPPQIIERFWNGKRRLNQDHLVIFSKAFQCRDEDIISSPMAKKERLILEDYRRFDETKKREFEHYIEFLKTKDS